MEKWAQDWILLWKFIVQVFLFSIWTFLLISSLCSIWNLLTLIGFLFVSINCGIRAHFEYIDCLRHTFCSYLHSAFCLNTYIVYNKRVMINVSWHFGWLKYEKKCLLGLSALSLYYQIRIERFIICVTEYLFIILSQ